MRADRTLLQKSACHGGVGADSLFVIHDAREALGCCGTG